MSASSDRRGKSKSTPVRVDLNTALVDDLAALPGVGFVRAERIVAARPFAAVDDLQRVKGIGPTLYKRLSALVSVTAAPAVATPPVEPEPAPSVVEPEPLAEIPQSEPVLMVAEPPVESVDSSVPAIDKPVVDVPPVPSVIETAYSITRSPSRPITQSFNLPEPETPKRRVVHVERRKIRPYRSSGGEVPPPPPSKKLPELDVYRLPVGEMPRRRSAWPGLVLLVVSVFFVVAVFWFKDFFQGLLFPGAGVAPSSTPAVAQISPSPRPPLQTATPTRAVLDTAVPSASLTPTLIPSLTPTRGLTVTVTQTVAVTPTATSRYPTATPTVTPTATASPTATPTLTPSPTLSTVFIGPDPLRGAGAILFDEKFAPRSLYWGTGVAAYGRSQIENGALTVVVKSQGSLGWVMASPVRAQDFFVMGTVTVANCAGSDHYGLVFWSKGNLNLWLFGVTCAGQYQLMQMQEGKPVLVIAPTAAAGIQPGAGAVNLLGVRAADQTIELYINAQHVASAKANAPMKGAFGVYAASVSTARLVTAFDDMKAWEIKP